MIFSNLNMKPVSYVSFSLVPLLSGPVCDILPCALQWRRLCTLTGGDADPGATGQLGQGECPLQPQVRQQDPVGYCGRLSREETHGLAVGQSRPGMRLKVTVQAGCTGRGVRKSFFLNPFETLAGPSGMPHCRSGPGEQEVAVLSCRKPGNCKSLGTGAVSWTRRRPAMGALCPSRRRGQ